MKHPFITVFFAAGLATGTAFAADDTAATPEEEEPFTIQTATCGDIYDLFEDASPGEGKEVEKLEAAQDMVLYFVIWVHGYLSGRDGIDQEKRPLSKEGIDITVKQIDDVCKPDDSKRFLDVVKNIK
jgi:hypothetical protein